MARQPFDAYRLSLEKALKRRDATEHTHRPALKKLLESLYPGTVATNEPKRVKCGAVDIVVTKGAATTGFVETKDVDDNLGKTEKGEQLKRYRAALPNLILTDYLEFRHYIDGRRVKTARLGTVGRGGRIKLEDEGGAKVRALLEEFFAHEAPPPATATALAERLAGLAHNIRGVVKLILGREDKRGHLHEQMDAFKKTLIPDLDEGRFADMYAQTLAYGLFAARVECPEGKTFTRHEAAGLIPHTNPFLQKMFHEITGPDIDDRLAPEVDYLAEVLNAAKIEDITKDFAHRKGREDPVVHFYEDFLAAYDPKMRERRGVYYTPEPVVSYIVRSVDEILKKDFKKPLGLADDEVFVLDPACGTGSFLHEVIRLIHKRLGEAGELGTWSDYVRKKLLPRIFGFELLVAPYAIAHMKLGMLLKELDPEFPEDQRIGVYLTNTLDKPAFVKGKHKDDRRQLALGGGFGLMGQIVDEGVDAEQIKEHEPVMVVLGNPPYSNFGRANKGKWILDLLKDYKKGLKEKKLNLDDDFIKFIRFGQWRIGKTGEGILAYISSNTYIDGITHRRMRESLMATFDKIHVLDLHGSTRKKEKAPDGSKDENVFDIMQGVSIGLFTKRMDFKGKTQVKHAELWGTRKDKYACLEKGHVGRTKWQKLDPQAKQFFFVPRSPDRIREYQGFLAMDRVFNSHGSGFNTDRDSLCIDFRKGPLAERMQRLFAGNYGTSFAKQYRIVASSSYDVATRATECSFDERCIVPCTYRPFDTRWAYYQPGFTSRPVFDVQGHMLRGNVALLVARQSKEPFAVLATRHAATHKIVTVYDRTSLAPLYLYDDISRNTGARPLQRGSRKTLSRQANLVPKFVEEFAGKLKLKFVSDGRGDLKKSFGPEDVFDYIYAVLHSPAYRKRYAEFLKSDFPRVPLTSDRALFRKLVKLGGGLVGLHLMESATLDTKHGPAFNVRGSSEVEKVRYEPESKRVYINDTQHFQGVPQEVWDFHVGGYQVMRKWLKDRKGRRLTTDDVRHYRRVAVALAETMKHMKAIDKAIPRWPIK